MKLLLFDIDGTLIKGGADGTHHDSFSYATKKVFGKGIEINNIKPAGKIDPQILMECLETKGIKREESKARLPELFSYMVSYCEENMKDLRPYVLPNTKECLDYFSKRKDVMIGLLTGNLEEIAWQKMKEAGLRDYFTTGAFGNEGLLRDDLVSIALTKTRSQGIHKKDIFIIGDAPLDISCAKNSGSQSAIVSSGEYSYEELKQHNPDFLVRNIFELTKIL